MWENRYLACVAYLSILMMMTTSSLKLAIWKGGKCGNIQNVVLIMMCFFICKLFSVLSEEFHFLGCALRSSRTLEMFWVTYCSVCCLLGLFFNCEDGGRTFFHILVHYETARCHIAEDSFLHLFLKPLTNLHVNFQTEL